jgi:hypothetical protein
MGANLAALHNTCSQEAFAAGNCPAASIVGVATAVTPIVADPLSGPVYLVKLPDKVLPGLVASLHGVVDMPVTITNSIVDHHLSSTVTNIPDVPLTRFDLMLKAGALLQADTAQLCAGPQKISAQFTSHSGATSLANPVLATPGCSLIDAPLRAATASGSIKRHGGKPVLSITVRGKGITAVRMTLPRKSIHVSAKHVRSGGRVSYGKVRNARTISAKGQVITARASKRTAGVSSLTITLKSGALIATRSLRVGKSVSVKLTVTHAGGKVSHLTTKIKPRR